MIFASPSSRKYFFRITLAAAILLFRLLGCPVNVFSQEGQGILDQGFPGQGRRILDYQFDRADRELRPDRWMEEARRGVLIARAVWAEMVPEVFTENGSMAAFDEWSEKEMEKRFMRWLLERFFGAGMEVPSSELFREKDEADKYLVYHTGEDGKILFNPQTGDPLVIRPGDEDREFAQDLLSWREITANASARELQAYGEAVRENYPELLIYVSPEREKEFLEKIFSAGSGAVQSLKHEFEAILAREERYFTAQRLGDVWSLRKKSEDQSADAICSGLIEEARQACADGIASIEEKIEAAKGDDTDLTLAGSKWLEEFRKQFNRGLQAWESAEERFLIRRLEWEYSAEKSFRDGLETWDAAFARFEEERLKWEEQARILFLEGERFFTQASETLEKAIAGAKAEFEIESRIRIDAASGMIGNLANMYILSSSAAAEAKKNIDFWIWQYREIKRAAAVPGDFTAIEKWVNQERSRYPAADNGLEAFILEEIKAALTLYGSYTEKAGKYLEDLKNELPSLTSAGSYEAELFRAEGELEYWIQRGAMAEAVAAYAAALDAGRTTASESAYAWEKARASCNEATLLYSEAEDSLKTGGAELSDARDALAAAAEKMRIADAAMETLHQNYKALTAIMEKTGSALLAEEYAFLHQELAKTTEALDRCDENSVWAVFLSSAMELETRQYQEYRKILLSQLIAGDGGSFYSLAALAGKENPADESSRLYTEDQFTLRMAAISLLLEQDSLADWYSSVYERRSGRSAAITMSNMEQQLLFDWEKARLNLLIARSELEGNAAEGQEADANSLQDFIRDEAFCGSLYNTFITLAPLAPVVMNSNIDRGLMQLGKLWETLGIDTGQSAIPETESLVSGLKKLEADFNIYPLFLILDEIFSPLPSFLGISFYQWKASLSQYCASPTEENFALAERQADVFNAAILLFKNHPVDRADFEIRAAMYLEDPMLEWDETDFIQELIPASGSYENALEELQNLYSTEDYIRDEIKRLSPLVELSDKGKEEIEKRFSEINNEISLAEEAGELLKTAYRKAAENYRSAGERYDALFETADAAFKNLGKARKAFEIQDAVRQWAETAYLDSKKPEDELAFCRQKITLALDALEILKSVNPYGNQNQEYTDAALRFEEDLSLYISALEALYKHERYLEAQRRETESAYTEYQEQLSLLGKSFITSEIYISPEDMALWGIKDVVTVKNGILVFARDEGGIISGCDEQRFNILTDYFSRDILMDGEAFRVSPFELALRDLTKAFSGLSESQYKNLALARDYLIKQLLDKNPGLEKAGSWKRQADALRNGNLSDMTIGSDGREKVKEKAKDFETQTLTLQSKAWNSLDEETKKNLEFYTILTLLGGGGKQSAYFSRVSEFHEYNSAHEYVASSLEKTLNKAMIPVIGWIYMSDAQKLQATMQALRVPLEELHANITAGYKGLKTTLTSINNTYKTYTQLSAELTDMEKENQTAALRLTAEACMRQKEESYGILVQVWNKGEEERKAGETIYRELYNVYLAGDADAGDLREAAISGFAGNVPRQSEYQNYIGALLLESLAGFSERGLDGTPEQSRLVLEYAVLISKAREEKYSVELSIRENEWDLQRRDIREKFLLWQESAAAILENGRTAWKEGDEKLREACNVWINAFREEYGRISDQWTATYLEGLHNKEAWAEAALEAAAQASSAELIALVGADAEAGARAMDTRDPFAIMNLPDMREGEKIISDLLERSGTGYLAAAFGSIQVSGESLAAVVRTGIGSGGAWNSGLIMSEASGLAKSVREEFEGRESQKMAFMVMNTAREACKIFEDNLLLANEGFREQMDEFFIMGGQWRRSGTGYIKDVIVYSTLFYTAITDSAGVEGFRYFTFPNTRLSASLYDDLPKNMNSFQADALMDSIYEEINGLFIKAFGSGEAAGEFQLYLGREPVFKQSDDIDLEEGRKGIFEDFGEGELGRLLTEFYYWMAMEQQGINMMDMAPWDKPLWDSRGSKFEAPSLRNMVNIIIQTGVVIAGAAGAAFTGGTSFIGAVAISAAINTADDLLFAALDLAGGYKSWGEVGMEFGKNVIINVASAAVGSVFNGVGGAASSFLNTGGISGIVSGGIGGALWKGLSAGVQVFTTGTISSAIGSVTLDQDGLGFSTDNFKEGIKQSAISALAFSAGTFTSGIMNLGLEGFTGSLFRDGSKLSQLAGGLASQGINYAFGNDFTLNIFNLGLIAGIFSDKDINAGLLELHLGRDGVSLQFGTGGADVSLGTIWSAMKGSEAYFANLRMLLSDREAADKYTRELRALYSQDTFTRQEFENVLAGTTVYSEWGMDFTESYFDEKTGIKTVYLGRNTREGDSSMGLAVYFAHEAYRDGIAGTAAEQILESETAIMGHIRMADSIAKTYGTGSLENWMNAELGAYNDFLTTGNSNMLQVLTGVYETSGDFWKLLASGAIAYDGLATLSDEEGRIIKSADSMKVKESAIETALIKILGFDPSDKNAVDHVRSLMVSSGLVHSYGDDPESWYWRGTHMAETVIGDEFVSGVMNLGAVNMGMYITVSAIAAMFDSYNYYGGDGAKAIGSFISGTYGSAISFLFHSDTYLSRYMLSNIYSGDQLAMVINNMEWLKSAYANGINTLGMITGNVKQTTAFGELVDKIKLESSSIPDARFFSEEHTGIDYGSGGTSISVPGGYWEFIKGDDHKAYYQLFGSDLMMRIQHIDPKEIENLVAGTIYGGDDSTLLPYPAQSYGSGSGAHIHIDMTMRLPFNNYYTRQFINPWTLMPGNQLNYQYRYYDEPGNIIQNRSGYFYRY